MPLFRKKPFVIAALLLLGLVVLPATIFFFQRTQETRSRAEKTVDLSFEPGSTQANPIQIPAGTTFTLDVFVDPGANSVSYVKAEMIYDTTKFAPAGGFIPNQDAFSQVVETVNMPGKVITTLSIGSDLSKALRTKTKVGTLALKALNTVPANTVSNVSFGSGSQALSVSSNSTFNENVIATTVPVSIKINRATKTCGTSPSDALLVIDKSGSMNEKEGSSGTKITHAKSSANNFIDILASQQTNRTGLVTYDSTGKIASSLTSDFASVKNQVNAISVGGGTCIECGINKANQEIAAHKRNTKNVVILLTDGRANTIDGSTKTVSETLAEQKALVAALKGHVTNGTVFYTIGLGKNVDSTFLTLVAKGTGGHYYFSPTTDQLNDIYIQISQTLAHGSVSGVVFNDANHNSVFEPTEPGIPGVLLQLYPLGSSTPQLISTDSEGTYNIQNLCDGTYTVKQMVPTFWRQTLPSDIRGYTLTISNGAAVTDKDFGDTRIPRCSDTIDNDGNGATDAKDSTCHTDGNPGNPGSYDPNRNGEHGNSTCSDSKDNNANNLVDGQDPVCHVDGNENNASSYDPTRSEITPPTLTPSPAPSLTQAPTASPTTETTPTTPPTGTGLSIDVLLHGIGNSGDNANPTASSLSNKNPLHNQRAVTVALYDINNNFVATASGDVAYSSTSGSFKGMVYTPEPITAGKYSAKIRTDYHLTRLVSGILNLVADQTNQLPSTELVAGDANNDNQLNILDYNLLLGCYSDLSAAPDCTSAKKLATDLNDDDAVNQFDYNLFLREISTQPGE